MGAKNISAFFASFLLFGCTGSVTEADCKEVGEHLREIWTAEAKFPDTPGPSTEKAIAVIKSEASTIEQSFVTDCKKQLLGKPRSSSEFSCLSHAKTLADVRACATIPEH